MQRLFDTGMSSYESSSMSPSLSWYWSATKSLSLPAFN